MRRLLLISILLLPALSVAAQDSLVLSLGDCLSTAEQRSPMLEGSSLDILSARAQRTEARLEYMPKVELTGFAFYALHPLVEITLKDILGNTDAANDLNNSLTAVAQENGIKTSYSTLKWGYGAAASLMQPVYAGGRIRAGNRLADLGVEAALLQDSLRRRVVRDSIESKYWRVVALQEKQKTLRETLALLDTLDKDVKSARSAGLATEPQQLELSLKRSELNAGIRRLEGGLSLMKMDLLATAGYPYKSLSLRGISLRDTVAALPAPSEVILAEPAIAETDESRLLQLQVDARIQEKKMAVGEYLPQVAVGAGVGYSGLTHPKNGSFNALVFGTVRIPLTDIPKAVVRSKRYDYAVQKAASDQAWLTEQLYLRERMLALEVETAWDQWLVASEAAALAEDSLSRIRIRYEAGSASMAEVMQAALSVSSARELLEDRRIAYRLAVNRYNRCNK